jgi:hypothetical protein
MMSEGNVNGRQENYEKKITCIVITVVPVNIAELLPSLRNGVSKEKFFSAWGRFN